jgi:hypothetical protein
MTDGPLVLSHRQLLVAIDPASGHKVWEHKLGSTARRLFRIGPRLFAAYDTFVCFLDMQTGALLGHVDVGFRISAGFVKDGHLFIAGDGAACLRGDGSIVWQVVTRDTSGWVHGELNLVCVSPDGREIWRSMPLGTDFTSDNTGLVLGDVVAQPDMKEQ